MDEFNLDEPLTDQERILYDTSTIPTQYYEDEDQKQSERFVAAIVAPFRLDSKTVPPPPPPSSLSTPARNHRKKIEPFKWPFAFDHIDKAISTLLAINTKGRFTSTDLKIVATSMIEGVSILATKTSDGL